jgi:pimeloyl-ACP methyl ester carboxylesterase
MEEIANACWEAADVAGGHQPAVVVGCSVGASIAQHMYHQRKTKVSAVVLSGTGWRPNKEFVPRHIDAYRQRGVAYRWEYTLMDFSEAFRVTPQAEWFARVFSERNEGADVPTIIRMFEAQGVPDPPWLQAELQAPVLIITGTRDNAHPTAGTLQRKFPNAELIAIEGAGHACHMESPWEYDQALISFLRRNGHPHLPNQASAVP